jgi:CRP/FNR family transcriptional regulator, anaerobic regulatory protein
MQTQKKLRDLGLEDSDIAQVVSIFTKKISLKSGEFFVQKGQIVDGIGLIISGGFRFFYVNQASEEITVWATLGGDFVTSLASFMRGMPARENIKAMKDSEVLIASKKQWEELLDSNQKIKNIWLKSVENLYLSMEERVHNLIVYNAEQRYEWMCKNQSHFIAEIPDKYIASMLGITPRHLTRIRAKRK